MYPLTKETFLLHSRLPEFKQKVDSTLFLIKNLVEQEKCVVCYSGGKDSIVLLHLALQVDPKVLVWHWDHGSQLMPREVEEELICNAKVLGAVNLIVRSSLAVERVDMRDRVGNWYGVYYANKARVKSEYGWGTELVGLRADEGVKRRLKTQVEKKGEAYPLKCWSWLDVWAYIVSRKLPYPGYYDVVATNDINSYRYSRFVTFFDKEFDKFGSTSKDGFFFPQYRHNK
ncbi:MAG: phosphoadenosine phosphosulfate reductase family protein [Candidatus Bathyarchaeota archaeon]|nr:phosphoadenosine phosphosulfate reductase family protein [Candidatus Termiticorpusculum sp.]